MAGNEEEETTQASERAGLVILGLAIILLMLILNTLADQTGAVPAQASFGPYETGVRATRPATPWDWLELLVVPAVLAGGVLLFNHAQKQAEDKRAEKARALEREIAADRQRQASLEGYYRQMKELLLEFGLGKSLPKDDVRNIARALTMAALGNLDPDRKTQLFRFLVQGGLLNDPDPIVILTGTNLAGANLFKVRLANAELAKTDLSGADLTEANLIGAIMSEANLSGAKLSRANLSEVYLYKANLVRADLMGAKLTNAVLTGSNLSEAFLLGAILSGVEMYSATLTGAELTRSDLKGAKLNGADFSGARLTKANLSTANLAGTVLQGADLRGANFDAAELSYADLSEARYSASTIWPYGFDPVAAGAMLMKELQAAED